MRMMMMLTELSIVVRQVAQKNFTTSISVLTVEAVTHRLYSGHVLKLMLRKAREVVTFLSYQLVLII